MRTVSEMSSSTETATANHLEQKLNINKSEIMYCGSITKSGNKWTVQEAENRLKVLGVYMGKDPNAACKHTWEGLEGKVKNRLALWRQRALSLKGKAVVANALALSQLQAPLWRNWYFRH